MDLQTEGADVITELQTETRPLWFIANRARVHLEGAETGGVFDLVEVEARGVGTPPGFADFVREASDPAEDDGFPPAGRAPDLDRIGAAAARQRIELLGPPGTMPG
jgi:hypothetical protein